MKRILITGAMGQLGLALNQLLDLKDEYRVLNTDVQASESNNIIELDISDKRSVELIVRDFKPDIIINCAAMTAVDLCESKQDKAYQINALGPKYLAMAAEELDAKMIHISTDYVFNGQAKEAYVETDSPDPINVYGRTKLAGEKLVIDNCKKSLVIRTAWLYGQGKNFASTMMRLAKEGKDIKVVDDQHGTPTSARELAKAIMFLMERESYGTYHASCEGETTWYEFALKIFEEVGIDVSVKPIPTSQYPTPALRPMNSVLDNKRLREEHGYYMKTWEDAFQEFAKIIK